MIRRGSYTVLRSRQDPQLLFGKHILLEPKLSSRWHQQDCKMGSKHIHSALKFPKCLTRHADGSIKSQALDTDRGKSGSVEQGVLFSKAQGSRRCDETSFYTQCWSLTAGNSQQTRLTTVTICGLRQCCMGRILLVVFSSKCIWVKVLSQMLTRAGISQFTSVATVNI